MKKLWSEVRALGRFLRSRIFAVSMLSLVLAFVVYQITTTTNTVYVIGEDGRTVSHTMENRPDRILQSVGLGALAAGDPGLGEISGHYVQVDTTKSFRVTLTADGETQEYEVDSGTTVSELLHDNGIEYDGNDLLDPPAEKSLEDGDEVVLQRVEYEKYTVDEEIPYETVRKNSPLLRVGNSRTIQPGADGIKTLTYVQRTVDGEKEDVQLLGEKVTLAPVTETILIGSLTPVSPLDFDLNVDEEGRPVEYARLLTNQVATGYSARQGAKTASGRYAVPGHVAVDPREIPYGSRLYIVSHDNNFIYGCAIAADTGTGLLADIVDVDLFYDTYAESALNGRKIVDIYVLD